MEKQIIEVTSNFVSPEERTRLVRLCTSITGDVDAAEDLAQETLLEAWRHEYALRDPGRCTQWLSGIARNVCLRWLRKRERDFALSINLKANQEASLIDLEDCLADDFDVEIELERRELIELLDRAMTLLPAETRAVLVKRYVEESPIAEVAEQLGTNVSAVSMRLQRGKLALRRVLTTNLRQEIAPYAVASTTEQWEETPFWCHLCGQHRLLGIRNPVEGKLLFKCPGCNPGAGELMSYNNLPLLKGVKGYRPLFNRLRNWCAHYYWTALRDGVIACPGCGRRLPVRIIRAENLPDWVQSYDEAAGWARTYYKYDRLVAIYCESCRDSYRSVLEYLVLGLPEGQRFLQSHPRIRTLPNQEIETEGRLAIVTRAESVTDNATLTVIADYETYKVLHVDGVNQ